MATAEPTPPPDRPQPESDADAAATRTDTTAATATSGPAGLIIRLPTDPEALRRLEAREQEQGAEPACLPSRLCPRCGAPGETSVNRICTDCGAALTR
jgi:hypothetical protein